MELTFDEIEGKVNSLSYDGFGALEDWCIARGVPIVVPEEARDKIIEIIATRNIITYNKGRVDKRFIRALSKLSLQLVTLGL